MKKVTKKFYISILLLILAGMLMGCSNDSNEQSTTDSQEESSNTASIGEEVTEKDENTSEDDMEGSNSNEASGTSSEENDDKNSTSSENSESNTGDTEVLSPYSSQQIEYARIWLQLGPNQEIDELNVQHIQADEPINPGDETSADYPEDVIQLSGGRLVDDSVTYSGNGDGTVNVYNVPLRWDGQYPAGEAFYIDIIESTKLESIDPGNDEEVVELIQLLNVH